jgi:hypothetical protein
MGTKSAASVGTTTGITNVQVLLDFKTYSEKKFEPFMNKVVKCSTDNPYKTVTPALLANCVLRRDEYVTARTNRDANPSPANTQFLESAHLLAAKAFGELAVWVQDNCDDDRAIALSFGFKVAKAVRVAATKLPMPSSVTNDYGMPGTIIFKCKSLGRNVKYFVEYTLDGGITWMQCGFSTKSFSIIASGLVRGKEYIFRIYGLNDAGPGYPWTSGGIIAAV